MFIFRGLLVSALLVASGCFVPIPSSTEIAPALSGTVTDAASGQPLRRVMVTHRFDDQIVREACTDDRGRFAVDRLEQRH